MSVHGVVHRGGRGLLPHDGGFVLAKDASSASLRHITSAHICDYQNARTDLGRAPKTINGELSVLRQVMKHARVWYRCEWAMSAVNDRHLTVKALEMALKHRCPEAGLLHHFDHGSTSPAKSPGDRWSPTGRPAA